MMLSVFFITSIYAILFTAFLVLLNVLLGLLRIAAKGTRSWAPDEKVAPN
ncbi:MAG: hypothetical protein QME66_09475 [Candidatus Eisenbacteria bacterium]|nr:hypothetical protein [Candidatus Eisenbacteria bacterium]